MKTALLAALLTIAPLSHAAEPAAGCRYDIIATLPLFYSGNIAPSPSVAGSINGAPARMLISTAAWMTVLTPDALAKHQLSLANGQAGYLRTARLREFSIGPLGGVARTVNVDEDMPWNQGHDAILGMDFLMQGDLEMDLAGKQMRLYRASGCAGKHLAYWDPEAIKLPMLTQRPGYQQAAIAITVNGVAMEALLDSGYAYSSISEAAARRAGIDTAAPGVQAPGPHAGIGAGRGSHMAARFTALGIGPITVHNAQIGIRPARSFQFGKPDVTLGADFFRAHRVLIANSQRQIYLSYLGGDVFAPRSATPEAWHLQEAADGNADALYALTTYGHSEPARLQEWLSKAAALGHKQASADLALRQTGSGTSR